MIKTPIMWLGSAVIGALGLLYVMEVLSHAGTRSDWADAERQHAIERDAYAKSTIARAEAVAAAQTEAQSERDAQDREIAKLSQAATRAAGQRKTEAAEAAKRLAALEAENAELSEWADTGIPGDFIVWMRGETAAVPAP